MFSDSEKELRIIGTQINYYFICKTKLWLFSHHIQMEQESELVSLGKTLHQDSYKRDKRDQTIDNLISFDFIRKGDVLEIHEVKKSKKMSKAHHYQLLYYLYYLKNKKGIENAIGIIDYPKLRRRETLKLDERNQQEIQNITKRIGNMLKEEMPAPSRRPACRRCAYYEFCFV